METAPSPKSFSGRSFGRRPGMTLVELLVVVAIISALVAFLLPAVQSVRETARRMSCANNLRHVGCALHGHLLLKGKFPIGCLEWKAGTGGTNRCIAWSAFILPWLEEQTTASRVNYQKPYDDLANAAAAATVIRTYLCPSAGRVGTLVSGMGGCDYGGVVGERIVSPNNPEKGVICTGTSYGVKDVTDGISKTILVAECSREPWADGQWINGRNLFDQAYAVNVSMPFWEDEMRSRHPSGAHGLAGDGSVQFVEETVDKRILAAAMTRSRGESPAAPWVAP
jgi:prepilin-type N-terminal cleavage/methylation domain-containing protein